MKDQKSNLSHSVRHLQYHLPIVFHFIDQKKVKFWKLLDQAIIDKIKDRRSRHPDQEVIQVDAHLYDIFYSATKGNYRAKGMVDLFKKMFEELLTHLNKKEQQLIRPIVRTFVSTLEMDYLHSAAELSVLLKIMRSGKTNLVHVEYPFPHKKQIDFLFQEKGTERFYAVEVMNIHLDDHKVAASTDEDLLKFINNRISSKTAIKGGAHSDKVHVTAILWGELPTLKRFTDICNRLGTGEHLQPLCYIMVTDGESYFRHHFGSLTSCFKAIADTGWED